MWKLTRKCEYFNHIRACTDLNLKFVLNLIYVFRLCLLGKHISLSHLHNLCSKLNSYSIQARITG